MSKPTEVTSLTVQELIDMLQEIDDKSLPVVFSYNYGDHWHTTVLGEIGQVQEETCKWSDYHSMFSLPERDSEDDDEADIPVIVLS